MYSSLHKLTSDAGTSTAGSKSVADCTRVAP